jgi:exodeoxyribonuclease VII small subunit
MAKAISYKESMAELEQLLRRMESGDEDLDQLQDQLKRGKELLDGLYLKLANAEKIVANWEKDEA